ncbi:MAG: hypothetical protein QW404_00165 [Candidatus Nanoarchaeia archaeon]
MVTPLSRGLEFLKDLGFYDIILPFLLIFTVAFGVLEKTRIFGQTEDKKPKTNINAMIAFVISLFFVATPRLVESLQISLPQIALLLVVLMSLMMVVGFIMSDKEFSFETHKGLKIFLIFCLFVGIILIFLNAVGWWEEFWDMFGFDFWTSTAGMTLIFLGVVIGAILFITSGGKKGGSSE